MADSFNGIAITVVNDTTARAAGADISVRHIPDSDTDYIDIGGRTTRTQSLVLLFGAGGDAVAFEAQVGSTGTLVCMDGTYPVLLEKVSRTRRDLSSGGRTTLQADFRLL